MINVLIRKYRTLLLFGIAGVLGYLVDFGVTISLEPVSNQYISRIPAFLFAATATWVFNRSITFKNRRSQKGLFAEWLHYLSLMTFGLFLNYVVYVVVVTFLPTGVSSIALAVALGSLVGMVANFFTSSKFLYKK